MRQKLQSHLSFHLNPYVCCLPRESQRCRGAEILLSINLMAVTATALDYEVGETLPPLTAHVSHQQWILWLETWTH